MAGPLVYCLFNTFSLGSGKRMSASLHLAIRNFRTISVCPWSTLTTSYVCCFARIFRRLGRCSRNRSGAGYIFRLFGWLLEWLSSCTSTHRWLCSVGSWPPHHFTHTDLERTVARLGLKATHRFHTEPRDVLDSLCEVCQGRSFSGWPLSRLPTDTECLRQCMREPGCPWSWALLTFFHGIRT